MFEDKQELLDNFLDLQASEQEALLREILVIGNQNKEDFESYVSLLAYGLDSTKSIFYEAVWKNPKGWEHFALNELENLIHAAEHNVDGAEYELGSIFYLTQLSEMEQDFYEKAVDFLVSKLNSSVSKVRKACIEAITHIIDISEFKLSTEQKTKMQVLLTDASFYVRLHTYSNLKDFDLVPNDYKFSFLDKLRTRLIGKSYLIK